MEKIEVASHDAVARTGEVSDRATWNWQRRLLPFMASMLVVLGIFATLANFYQTHVMQQYIEALHEVDLAPAWERVTFDNTSTLAERVAWAQWRTLALLESQALRSRYHQTSVILMGRVYLIFIGFTTGVVMVLIGAAFILGKLQETVSAIDTGAGAWRLAVQSSSPGLILAALGTVLILGTIWARSEVESWDRAVYITASPTDVFAPQAASKSAQRAQDDILHSVRKAEDAKAK